MVTCRATSGLLRFARAKVDSLGPEVRRRRCLRRPCVHLGTPGDLEIDEAGRLDDRGELCFQQSTRDSTGPELNILLRSIRHRLVDRDVADLQATGRFEDSRHFAERLRFVWGEVEHTV